MKNIKIITLLTLILICFWMLLQPDSEKEKCKAKGGVMRQSGLGLECFKLIELEEIKVIK